MTGKFIEMFVVFGIVSYVLYRNATKVKKQEKVEKKYTHIFHPRHSGKNPPESFKCMDLDDARKHPIFKNWEDNYRLWQSNRSNTVRMVQDGRFYHEGFIVGYLEEIKE